MNHRKKAHLSTSGVAVASKIDAVPHLTSISFPTAPISLPAPKIALKRPRSSSLLSSSLSSPRAATSSASSALPPQREQHFDGSSSADSSDCDGPASASSITRRIRRRVASASSAPPLSPALLRSVSSDSYFVSAINRNPSICLFAALSHRGDFSLLCDDSVLSALSRGPPASTPHSTAATASRLKPLSRLKAAVLRTISSLHAAKVGAGGGKGSTGGGTKSTRSCSFFVNVTWQAKTFNDLLVALDATPASLKLQLETITGVPADCQKLICSGRTLDGSAPLIELGVEDGDKIELVSVAAEAAVRREALHTTASLPPGMHLRVSNIVAVVHVSGSLSLPLLSGRMSNSEYNPKRFAALTVRLKEPPTTAMVYSSGKMIISGAQSMEHLHRAVILHVRGVKKAGYPDCQVLSVTIANMVASINLCTPLRLEALHLGLGGADGGSQYDTEVFPAIIYRLGEPEVTLMIFSSGNVNIVGATSHSVVVAALEKMIPVLLLYKLE